MNPINVKLHDVELLMFYSFTNSHSLTIKNKLEEIADENGGSEFFKYYELTKDSAKFSENRIGSIPTVIILRNGIEYVRLMHAINPVKCAQLFVEAFKYDVVLSE